MKLTAKQELFVKEYLVDKNATQAAIRAGYSEKTAHDIGCENLKKPNIAKAIQAHLNKTHEKLDISIENIQKELAGMAFKDMSSGELYGMKHSDKHNALVSLGKSQAMFTDKVETELTGNIEVSITVKGHKA